MLPLGGQLALGACLGYLLASLSECLAHRCIGHAPAARVRRWIANPSLFGYLANAHFHHAVIHHRWTFRSDYVTQFDSDEHRDAVESKARALDDPDISGTGYGLRLTWSGMLVNMAPTVAMLPILALAAGPWSAVSAAPFMALAPALSRWIHPFLHRRPAADDDIPFWTRWLLRTWYFRAVARHHFLHHKYPDCNFNLLLGGDWLLGVGRLPTSDDLAEMRQLGID